MGFIYLLFIIIRDDNFATLHFASRGFFLPRKSDGVKMEQDFFPALQGTVGMGLGFLAWLLLHPTLLY